MNHASSRRRRKQRRNTIIGFSILFAIVLIITSIALGVLYANNTTSSDEEPASSQKVIQQGGSEKEILDLTTRDISGNRDRENNIQTVSLPSSTVKYKLTTSRYNEATTKSQIHTGNRKLILPSPVVRIPHITMQLSTSKESNGPTTTSLPPSTQYEDTTNESHATTTHQSNVDKKILQIEDDDVTTQGDVITTTTSAKPNNGMLENLFKIVQENNKRTNNNNNTKEQKGSPDNREKYKRPHGKKECSDVCYDVTQGKIRDKPVGYFASSGTSAIIYPTITAGIDVYCDCTYGSTNAWTVFQRRMDGSVNFQRNWNDYVSGFGDVSNEFWLGLETISKLTNAGVKYEVRVDMMDWNGEKRFAEYRPFSVDSSTNKYAVHIQNYTGNAGDSLLDHNEKSFSTYDADNDDNDEFNMAQMLKAGWWFSKRGGTNLNGVYYKTPVYDASEANGILWFTWKRNSFYSLKATEMKIRKITE